MLAPMLGAAQSPGKLRFQVDPAQGYHFVLDHQFRMQQREVDLSAGPHHFTFWAPQRRMVDTTITVLAGHTKDVLLRLPFSEEYRAYERGVREARKARVTGMLIPAAATLATGILAGVSYGKYKAAHQRLEDDRTAYIEGSDPAQLEDLREVVMPSHQAEFEDRERLFGITAGLFAAVAAGSAYMIIRTSKKKAPAFQDAQKVKFDGLVWSPGTRGGYFQTGFHIELR